MSADRASGRASGHSQKPEPPPSLGVKERRGGGTHLLNILLEDTELQPLVEPNLAVLPDVLELTLVVQDLVDDIQDVVHGLGVVGGGREGVGAAGGQGALELIKEGLPILAHLLTTHRTEIIHFARAACRPCDHVHIRYIQPRANTGK